MKRKKFIALLPAALTAAKAWAQSADSASKKSLIIYYSWSGNTRSLAKTIKGLTGADIVEVIPQTPYPSEYNKTVSQAKKEVDSNYKPPIKTEIKNISEYGLIFVGSPNWWGTISSPIRSVLASHDFSGKRIAPFITHEGSRMGRAAEDIKKLCPKSGVLEGLAVRGTSAKNASADAEKWLKTLGIL